MRNIKTQYFLYEPVSCAPLQHVVGLTLSWFGYQAFIGLGHPTSRLHRSAKRNFYKKIKIALSQVFFFPRIPLVLGSRGSALQFHLHSTRWADFKARLNLGPIQNFCIGPFCNKNKRATQKKCMSAELSVC